MRVLSIALLLSAITVSSFAQDSFGTLRNKFKGKKDVFYIGTNGLLARSVLILAGERDFKKAIKQVKRIRVLSVAKENFINENVSVDGFRKVLQKDNYEELTRIKDHGDDVTLYIKEATKKKHNRYFFLMEENNDVVAIEIRGYVDPNELSKQTSSASLK